MKVKFKKILFLSFLALLTFTACDSVEENEQVEDTEKIDQIDQVDRSEEGPEEREKKSGKKASDEISEEDKKLIGELLDYPRVSASHSTAFIRTFSVKDQKEEIRDQKIQAYTNYTEDGNIDSQELFIHMGEDLRWRILFRDGIEYVEKNSSNDWTVGEKDLPEAYISYYEILENLKSLEDILTVKKEKDKYILEFISHEREDFEKIKKDFHIDFPDDVKLTVMGQYVFDANKELVDVIQEIGTKTVNISIKSTFEEYNTNYPVMSPEVKNEQ